MEICCYSKAEDIPRLWDDIASHNYFLKRESLSVLEVSNPCEATYYIVNRESIFVTYRLSLNLLTYSKFKLERKITVIGVPLSVGCSGYILKNESHLHALLDRLNGFVLVLNTPEPIPGLAYGKTLPDIRMITPKTEELYIHSLKSNYKKRILKIKNAGFTIRDIDASDFSDTLYSRYEEVFNNSNFKLEKQSISYFRNYNAKIFSFEKGSNICGFIQTKIVNNTMYFILGGFDYKENKDSLLYLSMLYKVITEAIENKCESIILGQTAEEAKLRFGAETNTRYMNVYCKNKILLNVIKKIIKIFEYKENQQIYKVYKS